jgi:hypothetical protein
MVSSDSEDEDLLLAARQWATEQNDEDDDGETSPHRAETTSNWDYVKKNKNDKKKSAKQHLQPKVETPGQSTTATKNFSLHLTKVPFNSSQTTIRFAFTEKNCQVTSVRLVYDTDPKTHERTFRGVAFVDFADEASFDIGLKMHNTAFLGGKQRVNVRPTKTRGELSEIVKKTEERVAALIARSKEKKRAREEGNDLGEKRDGETQKKRQKNNKKDMRKRNTPQDSKKRDGRYENNINTSRDNKEARTNKASTRKNADGITKSKSKQVKTVKSNADGTPLKLTKKQRAQKAAVIRNLKSSKSKK